MPETPQLRLSYAFVPMPNPVFASASEANTNRIDLLVIVSNPLLSAVVVKQIVIDIPTGEETGRSISMQGDLPPPSYDTSIPWTIGAAGAEVTIQPSTGSSGALTGPILFTLPQIPVNETPGTVPITVTEFGSTKIVDPNTYSIVKQPSNFPVTRFWADPPSLDQIEQPVTLYWTCSEDGKKEAYGLEIVSTGATSLASASEGTPGAPAVSPFKNCVDVGDCYTWQDGQAGVSTGPISQTTTFALDVVQADSSGSRRVLDKLQAVVQVTLPYFSGAASQRLSPSGRLVRLRWLAFNAAYCTVALDGVPIDQDAPADTYQSGYLALLDAPPGLHQLSVVANAATGGAQVPYLFSSFQIGATGNITTPAEPHTIALTPDGRHVVLGTWQPDAVSLLDVATRTPLPSSVAVPYPSCIAITSDSSTALVTSLVSDGSLYRISLPGMTIASAYHIGGSLMNVAITPDGRQAVTVRGDGQVHLVQLLNGAVGEIASLGFGGSGLAITPDGAYALVTNTVRGAVAFLNLKTHQVEATVSVGDVPSEIAITPDGTLALVPNTADGDISVIDIAARAVEAARIPAIDGCTSIAISSDGRVALVANGQSNEATVVDIAARSSRTLSVGFASSDVAIARDGSFALISAENQSLVTLI
jgi:YVTN family beta-propeller protein